MCVRADESKRTKRVYIDLVLDFVESVSTCWLAHRGKLPQHKLQINEFLYHDAGILNKLREQSFFEDFVQWNGQAAFAGESCDKTNVTSFLSGDVVAKPKKLFDSSFAGNLRQLRHE